MRAGRSKLAQLCHCPLKQAPGPITVPPSVSERGRPHLHGPGFPPRPLGSAFLWADFALGPTSSLWWLGARLASQPQQKELLFAASVILLEASSVGFAHLFWVTGPFSHQSLQPGEWDALTGQSWSWSWSWSWGWGASAP